jgi:MFS superfamily sulfate permease-like transporter
VLVPESLAYASIAGVPPVVGLYAAAPALILYALAGSSRHLIVGPMSATAALSAAIIMPIAGADTGRYVALSAALAICTGLAGLVAALLRLGFVASFISEPVLKGFIVGLALTIIIGQVPKLLGIEKTPLLAISSWRVRLDKSGTPLGRTGDAPMLEIDATIDDALVAYEQGHDQPPPSDNAPR